MRSPVLRTALRGAVNLSCRLYDDRAGFRRGRRSIAPTTRRDLMRGMPSEGSGATSGGLRGRRLLLVSLVVLLAACVAAWLVGSTIARRLVIAEAEKRLDARVEIGALRFVPPLSVGLDDLVVVSEAGGERTEWLRVAAVRARVVSFPPFGELRLAAVEVDAPVLTIVRTPEGARDVLDLWRGGDDAETRRPPLDALRAAGARIVLLDRTGAEPPQPPVTIGDYALTLDASATPGTFALTLRGGGPRLGATAEGALDLAARTLALSRLDAHASLADASPAAEDDGPTPSVELRGVILDLDFAKRTVQLGGGTVALGGGTKPVLLDDVRGALALGDESLDGSKVALQVGGGTASGGFSVRFDEQPGWQASGDVANVDLAEVARLLPVLGGKVAGRLTGSGSFSGALSTDIPAQLGALRGSGRMRVREGEFYRLPLVASLLEQANMSSEGATLREAAATFRIADRTIHFDEAAVGSTSIGVQGHGDVRFDGTLQLDMVVMPLGDWKGQVERADVPVIGGAIAKLAGAAQSLFGKASAAVYEFHVSGTMHAPKLTPVPVPVLTRPAAKVFGRMAEGRWDEMLSE